MATRGKKEKEYPPMPANWMYKRGDVYMMDLNPYRQTKVGDFFGTAGCKGPPERNRV